MHITIIPLLFFCVPMFYEKFITCSELHACDVGVACFYRCGSYMMFLHFSVDQGNISKLFPYNSLLPHICINNNEVSHVRP